MLYQKSQLKDMDLKEKKIEALEREDYNLADMIREKEIKYKEEEFNKIHIEDLLRYRYIRDKYEDFISIGRTLSYF